MIFKKTGAIQTAPVYVRLKAKEFLCNYDTTNIRIKHLGDAQKRRLY